ncbi:MAG: NADH-quinone oxidoreductase subunit G [Rhodospirillales bacterium]|nr:NADH-quinone oxidoreductase subunit G [Rhodospirillales bacterium]
MPKLTIDGQEIEVEAGITVLQACERAGVEIPRFCYHERLSIAGNCRMCLVEQEKAPKPIASCAMPVMEGMVIKTDTPLVKKARRGVMEFLLVNHPLDCPICDQGGECDLQDQAMAYGMDHGRYHENKRAVRDKYMGPLVKTIMTRCIHCTRCVRFATEVAGVEELGALGRGEHMEITTYLEKALASEVSANVIDLCPVGALTSRPYAFNARPWELRKTESVDVMDAVGAAIRVDTRGREVMRVLPRLNEDVNEEWISDKSRYACDGLKRQRLDRPYIRKDGKLVPASWGEALGAVAAKLKGTAPAKIAARVGDLADAESIFALKGLMASLGATNLECRQDGAHLPSASRGDYLFNTTIAGIEKADLCLIVGANPRWEAALVNTRLRKRYMMGGFKVAAIGPKLDLTYPVEMLGDGPSTLAAIADGSHPFAEKLKSAKVPMLILGMGALSRPDGAAVYALARKLGDACARDGWNGFNVLHTAASRVAALDLGFVPATQNPEAPEVVYLLGADELDLAKFGKAFVIYQGHHGDRGAHRADVILPGAAYTEKNGIYVNLEGRVQLGRLASTPPGEAREDWKIVRALSDALGKPLPFNTLEALRQKLVQAHPVFAPIGQVTPVASMPWSGSASAPSGGAFAYPIQNFYMTDPISRASATMAECTEAFVTGTAPMDANRGTGTHG